MATTNRREAVTSAALVVLMVVLTLLALGLVLNVIAVVARGDPSFSQPVSEAVAVIFPEQIVVGDEQVLWVLKLTGRNATEARIVITGPHGTGVFGLINSLDENGQTTYPVNTTNWTRGAYRIDVALGVRNASNDTSANLTWTWPPDMMAVRFFEIVDDPMAPWKVVQGATEASQREADRAWTAFSFLLVLVVLGALAWVISSALRAASRRGHFLGLQVRLQRWRLNLNRKPLFKWTRSASEDKITALEANVARLEALLDGTEFVVRTDIDRIEERLHTVQQYQEMVLQLAREYRVLGYRTNHPAIHRAMRLLDVAQQVRRAEAEARASPPPLPPVAPPKPVAPSTPAAGGPP